jgi:A/G-specific adenine glycosylase
LWRKSLLDWYDAHGRDLPWRRTRDPYAILVSELMCQQTQVGTVIPYYLRWMERFPTASALAMAEEQEVLSYWQGLGYYRRARFLLQAARAIDTQGLPTTRDQWLKVPGVGRYTAGAISSVCFGQASSVVDGNVERVYARLQGDEASGKELHDRAWAWADRHVHSARPGDWNQALMELGAIVCRPVKPLCDSCPLQSHCRAWAEGTTAELPRKAPKQTVKHLRQHVFVPVMGGRFGVRQIGPGEWWEGMWEFPRESEARILEDLLGDALIQPLGDIRHTVTRHRIKLSASLAHCKSMAKGLTWLTSDDLVRLPMPAPQRTVFKLATERLGTI